MAAKRITVFSRYSTENCGLCVSVSVYVGLLALKLQIIYLNSENKRVFTGIIQKACLVSTVDKLTDFCRFSVFLPAELAHGLQVGASVAVDGCCQTVTRFDSVPQSNTSETLDGGVEVWFDAMQETLKRTTLSSLQPRQAVNIERAAKFGQEIGGHELSGHIDATIKIVALETTAENYIITLELPGDYSPYVFNKGYLGIHGASLTVSDLDKTKGTFRVYLIPETLRVTNLDTLKTGDSVNLEIDRRTQVIVDTVTAYLDEQAAN